MTGFDGRVALVTGGASGIGAATAVLLRDQGASVAILDLDEAGGRALAAAAPARAIVCRCDVADDEQVRAAVAATLSAFGGIDLVVNAAGIGSHCAKTPDLDPATWRRTMAVNLDGVFHVCRAAIPTIPAGGAIVNVASISGLAGDAGFNAYNASKAGLINYSRTLAVDHAADGIRVNCVSPGFVDTPLTAAIRNTDRYGKWTARAPMRRAGLPQEIANVIAFLLSDDASFMTGANVVVDGGMMAWTGQPDLLDRDA